MTQNPLASDSFTQDARVAEGKRLILEALREHQARLTAVRPPRKEKQESYEQTIARFGDMRGGKLYYPYLSAGLGHGALVELADGSVKYDMITGIGVHVFGHSDERIVGACLDAAVGDTVMQGNLQQHLGSVALTDTLLKHANASGANLAHCFLSTSGATANENALKIIFQKQHPRARVLAFDGAFAGRTLALSQITDRPQYRDGLPATLDVDYLPRFDAARPAESTDEAVRALNQHLSRYPNQHACIVIEPIVGEGGYYPGDRDFFIALFDVLREAGVAVFFDEVQTFGRTSRLFAFQHFGLDEFADVVTLGKMSQVCATLFRDEFTPRPGLVSQTFTGSTSAIAAAQVIVETMMSEGHFGDAGRNLAVHQRFVQGFEAIRAKHPDWIAGPYGLGGMIAFTPFDGSAERVKALIHALFAHGVIAFLAGASPARVRFLPPLGVIRDEEIDEVCTILENTLGELAEG